MTYTYEELERKAYMQGDYEKSNLYARLIQQEKDIDELEELVFDLEDQL